MISATSVILPNGNAVNGLAFQPPKGHTQRNGRPSGTTPRYRMIQERAQILDPLEFIRRCVAQKKCFWTYHVNMRMRGRYIPREIILASYSNYEVIEEYPGDKYLPSYLIYSEFQGEQIHILFAIDTEADNVRIITAYRPSMTQWEEDLKTRRVSP